MLVLVPYGEARAGAGAFSLCYCLLLPGTDTFAFDLADAMEHRVPKAELKEIIARIAKKKGPRAAR